jgi:hypothetical protein
MSIPGVGTDARAALPRRGIENMQQAAAGQPKQQGQEQQNGAGWAGEMQGGLILGGRSKNAVRPALPVMHPGSVSMHAVPLRKAGHLAPLPSFTLTQGRVRGTRSGLW